MDTKSDLPVIEIIIPFFNEETILRNNLQATVDYLQGQDGQFKWKLLLVNDGSRDKSGQIASDFVQKYPNTRVLNHDKNKGVGEALQLGFAESTGDYVLVMDADLSYSPEHIGKLYSKIRQSKAEVVVASPYMHGGMTENVPFFSKVLKQIRESISFDGIQCACFYNDRYGQDL